MGQGACGGRRGPHLRARSPLAVPQALLALVLAAVKAKVLVGLRELVHAALGSVDVGADVLEHVPPVLHAC